NAVAGAVKRGRYTGVIGLRPAFGEAVTPQRHRQIDFPGDMGRRGFLQRKLEQRCVVAEDAETEAVRPELLHAVRRRAGQRITAQAECELADVRNAVATAPTRTAHASHVDAVRKRIERAVGPANALQPTGIAQVGAAAATRMLMI